MTEEWSSKCGWSDDQMHMYVEPGTKGWKEHPYVQYAASLEARCRACEKCIALIREGDTPDGRREWFSEDTKRVHWRECGGSTATGSSEVESTGQGV